MEISDVFEIVKKPQKKNNKLLTRFEKSAFNKGVKLGRKQMIPLTVVGIGVAASVGYSYGKFKAVRNAKKLTDEDIAKIKEAVAEVNNQPEEEKTEE